MKDLHDAILFTVVVIFTGIYFLLAAVWQIIFSIVVLGLILTTFCLIPVVLSIRLIGYFVKKFWR